MKVYKYSNYTEYVKAQRLGYEKKKKNVWVKKKNIQAICEYLKNYDHSMGLCHGTRGGQEQIYFMDSMDCKVIGSEIGDSTAPNTVRWDFNQVNPEWVGKFDFVYSNAFDHAYRPRRTLRVWADQVKKGGHIIIEYDQRNEHTGEVSKPVNKIDPVSITIGEAEELFPQWINCDIKTINLPVVGVGYQKAIIMRVK